MFLATLRRAIPSTSPLLRFAVPAALVLPVALLLSSSFSSSSVPTTIMAERSVVKRIVSREMAEGDGARVRRSIGTPALKNFDPFLMLDEFMVEPPAGFPDHPHRGFETATYMLEGVFRHEDFAGHSGEVSFPLAPSLCFFPVLTLNRKEDLKETLY
jgi:hypothetical protein